MSTHATSISPIVAAAKLSEFLCESTKVVSGAPLSSHSVQKLRRADFRVSKSAKANATIKSLT
eukprot:scaffold4720_cov382-Prasinococcus_capsulatus_cf.AAC.4